MRRWLLLFGGLLIWAADFFLLYAIGSIFLSSTLARALTVIVTLASVAAAGLVLALALRRHRRADDPLDGWIARLGALGAALAGLAAIWQGLPALLS